MSTLGTVHTFCPTCDREVEATVVERVAQVPVLGETVECVERLALCPVCGNPDGDLEMERANQQRAFDAYRTAHDIVGPEGLRALRGRYGLSTRDFSRFLGFGEQTEHRYEKGAIPDRPHAYAIREATTPDGASRLLRANGDQIGDGARAKVEELIVLWGASGYGGSFGWMARGPWPSEDTGRRAFDLGRASGMAYELARRCQDLSWTVFQRTMCLADMLSFARRAVSLTGLVYLYAPFGPVVGDRETFRMALSLADAVRFEDWEIGEVVRPLKPSIAEFDEGEMALIGDIADVVGGFPSLRDLSAFSRELFPWSEERDGRPISYERCAGAVAEAVDARLVTR